jgi:excisionase family DNA binding protein
MAQNKLLSVKEAAEFLGISIQTLYGWCCKRLIVFVKVGRRDMFRQEDLNEFVERRRVQSRTTVWPRRSRAPRKNKTMPIPSSYLPYPFNLPWFSFEGVPDGTYEYASPDDQGLGCRFSLILNLAHP